MHYVLIKRLNMTMCEKVITLCWYCNIQMLTGITLQSILKGKQQKQQQKATQVIFSLYNFKIPHFKGLQFTFRSCADNFKL